MKNNEKGSKDEKSWLEIPLEISPARLPKLGKAKAPIAIFLGAAVFFVALGISPQLTNISVTSETSSAGSGESQDPEFGLSNSQTLDSETKGSQAEPSETASSVEEVQPDAKISTATEAASKFNLPDFTGLSLSDAERQLKALGLSQWRSVEQVAGAAKGSVLRTNPEAGSAIDLAVFNSTRTLEIIVSKGEAQQFVLPDFAGMTKTKAIEFLRSQGITRWKSSNKPSSIAKYLVSGSSPSAGTNIDVNTYNTEKWVEIYISTGEDAPINNATLVAYRPTISWSTIGDTSSEDSKGNWGFYGIVIDQGVLKLTVEASFPKDTTILLGNNCRFIVEGSFGLGCPNSMPAEVFAKAGTWTGRIPVEASIYLGGYSEPKLFEVELSLKDADGIRKEKLVFRISAWD